jgi:hypothetical protein
LLAVGEGASAQIRHPSTKLTAFENRELRFKRSLAFAYASAVISDQTRPVRAAEPPRDSFGSESFAGDYGLNPLFDAPAETVNTNNSQSVILSADVLLWRVESPN